MQRADGSAIGALPAVTFDAAACVKTIAGRPVFRPERGYRDDRLQDPRPPATAGERAGPASAPETAAPKKGGGMFGWVKKIFGGSAAALATPAPETRQPGEPGREGSYRRRRHRGGRGRNFHGDQRGPRDGQFGGPPAGQPPNGLTATGSPFGPYP